MSTSTHHDEDWRTAGEKLWDVAMSLNCQIHRRTANDKRLITFEMTGVLDESDIDGDLESFVAYILREFWSIHRERPNMPGDDDGEEWKKGGGA